MKKGFIKRQWPLIGVGIMLLLVAAYFAKTNKKAIQEQVIRDIIPTEGLKLKDIHYTYDDPDKKIKWVMDAREVTSTEDKMTIIFHDFQLKIKPKKGTSFVLKGDKGTYYRRSGKIDLMGNLKGSSGNGYRLIMEHAIMDEKTGRIVSDKNVKITGPSFSITGKGLNANLEKRKFKILSDVTTVVEKRAFH